MYRATRCPPSYYCIPYPHPAISLRLTLPPPLTHIKVPCQHQARLHRLGASRADPKLIAPVPHPRLAPTTHLTLTNAAALGLSVGGLLNQQILLLLLLLLALLTAINLGGHLLGRRRLHVLMPR